MLHNDEVVSNGVAWEMPLSKLVYSFFPNPGEISYKNNRLLLDPE